MVDDGAGMDEATCARAVEPFFSTKSIGQGTGLGLSMVHGLASQLGGTLTIQSHLGLGTSVDLWMPQTDALPMTVLNGVRHQQVAGELRGVALLVDDEELVRLSTADMLGELGYHVVESSSGEEALRRVENGEQIDLLITDILMPGMSGIELSAAVRKARPDLPVLLISGYVKSDGVEATTLPRLSKPFRKDELATILAQFVAKGDSSLSS